MPNIVKHASQKTDKILARNWQETFSFPELLYDTKKQKKPRFWAFSWLRN